MCGIAGALSLSGEPLETERLRPMVSAVAHRGPDDAGYLLARTGGHGTGAVQAFADREFRQISPTLPVIDSPEGRKQLAEGRWDLFLGHRRLSIIDLSPRGHQPMGDASGRVWLTYNGEVYNFRELRKQIEGLGHVFRGRSDTEVVLQAYRRWGIAAIERLNGMFAFALWDGPRRRVYLVRDRYGVKPLYYLQRDGLLLFGSEIKSILAYLPDVGVDLLAMNEYFSFQNVLTDRTLFQGVRMLPPGHVLRVDLTTGSVTTRQYWDFNFHAEDDRPEADLRDELVARIGEAVDRQCVSDVPVGSYLSGGMDSGTITALTARRFGRIFTFTGGFDLSEAADHEMTFDEREQAEKMANALQTEHYECVLHSGDIEAAMDSLVWHLEDLRVGQCYPNWYVARLAGKFVKVVMSGTGGDELFGGYPWRYAAAIADNGEDYVANYYRYWQRLVSNREKLDLYTADMIDRLGAAGDGEVKPLVNQTLAAFKGVFGRDVRPAGAAEQVNESLYFECKTFLHGLLVVEDKLSMAHSLETRVPFLDNDLVDFACRIPVRYKVGGLAGLESADANVPKMQMLHDKPIHAGSTGSTGSTGKNILRKAMERWLPREVVEGRKQGFSAPDESWFRGRCERYVRDVLLTGGAGIHEYIRPEAIAAVLDAHCAGRQNRRLLIWSLLSFEKWLGTFQGSARTPRSAPARLSAT